MEEHSDCFVKSRLGSAEMMFENGVMTNYWISEMDPASSISFAICKHFLTSASRNRVEELKEHLEVFYGQAQWRNKERLIWFDENF